jgi:DNA-binding transcriptional ArsR family regulator
MSNLYGGRVASLTTSDEELPPVGDVQTVLHALADPIRLEMVRRLASSPDGQLNCGDLYDTISKSTASHHFSLLVKAGITRRVLLNGARGHKLRRDDLDQALPGVLDSIVNAANTPH